MDNTDKILLPKNKGPYFGKLQVQVICEAGSRPIDIATVKIYNRDDPEILIDTLTTDYSGLTKPIDLPAPPLDYSMEPPGERPYSEYLLVVTAQGLKTVIIDGVQIFPESSSRQRVVMPRNTDSDESSKVIVIQPHYLYGTYPLKVYEDEVKEMSESNNLPPIVVPEFLVVHNGIPSDYNAVDYFVEYRDYIKNVVSSICYPNWTSETINAIILVTLSFTMNRYYTNWYQRQGYTFNITASPAYDQLWIYGRNIYDNISVAVDYMFNLFLARPGILQPILTQSCRGTITDCPRMLSIWGSKLLGDTGYDVIFILHFYYGDDLYISYTNEIASVIYPWQDTELSNGSTGGNINALQKMLDLIARAYLVIPTLEEDGIFGPLTERAVKNFQELALLPATGIVDAATWFSMYRTYSQLLNAERKCV
ncbi:MAG: peptidoglycan-binding protein [Anaerocolumna sp.]|jgi:peptidoglycan hydrolase-like protein with peptidoglycan-binding domain|nr:peptidoglycan-binding protein [Anaerocolumna sp.]